MILARMFRHWRIAVMASLLWTSAVGNAAAIPQLLVDMQTGQVLYEEQAGDPWHPASLTKLMTAYLTFEAIANGSLTLDSPVIISEHALSMPPSKVGLPVDTALRLQDALYLMVVKSANDIAVAIAETVAGSEPQFVARMNKQANALGMTATHYTNANGLHDPLQVTSARDLAILALTIRARFPQFDTLFATGTVKLGKANLTSQNNLLTHFLGTTGMKTGYVCASGLNIVATIERDHRQLMAVLLGGSSGRERGEMTAQLITRALTGELRPTGKNLIDVLNHPLAPARDMRPLLCGKEAKAYVASRAEQFPLGLKGEPSLLTDEIIAPTYSAATLGAMRDVPLPRRRPDTEPRDLMAGMLQEDETLVPAGPPLPRPRPLANSTPKMGSLFSIERAK